MPDKDAVQRVYEKLRTYLTETLLPFWLDNSRDEECGGFLTHFDREGKPTGETEKTFLMQIRMLYTMASAHRAGYGDGRCGELAGEGARFILDHYWDDEFGGWAWIADRNGTVTCWDKVGYGHCFGMYSFSEYFLATGDEKGKEAALRTCNAVCSNMIDFENGGFIELFNRDWTPLQGKTSGGDRKSFDVHMHMMEAFTTLYEMTGSEVHRRHLQEIIDLVCTKILHPEHGLGIAQLTYDYTPLPAINFDTTWGRDADVEPDKEAKPVDQTSPGHNTEFAWLLNHAAHILGVGDDRYADVTKTMCDHCIEFGIDPEFGGVYADVPMTAETHLTEKQFWQQAEALIGMLDACLYVGDEKYWDAFTGILDFCFDNLIVMEAGGEWYERVDRDGTVVDGDLGHSWKISYHTVRSMIQSIKRLEKLL